MASLETLQQLCALCATPGDEGAVFDMLKQRWHSQGLDVQALGAYALVATPGERKKADTILLIAHADSPGFIVSEEISETACRAIPLGGVRPKWWQRVMTADGKTGVVTFDKGSDHWERHLPVTIRFDEPLSAPLRKGDRLAWAADWECTETEIRTPFLDNRAGCAILADWYDSHAQLLPEVNVILAVTAMEEVNGFGAAVLAKHIQADLIIALDATYTHKEQGVELGKGPVVTLSDASVILSPVMRDRLLACGVPLQTEVYNFSGTDAKAFPLQGHTAPVIPLLLPTTGNHSPCEIASRKDYEAWPHAIAAVVKQLTIRP